MPEKPDLAEALKTNRTYQVLIASEIRKVTELYHHNIEKQRVLYECLRQKITNDSQDFGVSLPPQDEKNYFKKNNVTRTTSAVRKRIRLFRESVLLVDKDGDKPPPNNDEVYIKRVLKDIPRVHFQEKISPVEKVCLAKALQLRIQMKLTQKACDNFTRRKAEGEDASDRYSKEYKRIKNIDQQTIRDTLQDSDWPFIAHLLFCQTEPDRAKIQGEQPKRSALDCQIYWEGIETSNLSEWTEDELRKLKIIAIKHQAFNWVKIAEELGTSRSAVDCLRQYQVRFNRKLKKSDPWTQEEDDKMIHIIKEQCGDNDFLSISAHMEGRNQMQCFLRWRNTLRPGIKMRQKFTPEEDICLFLAVTSRGPKWKELVPHLDDVTGPGRTDLTARERFMNFMDPKLFFKEFTKAEEKAVDDLMQKHFADRIHPPPEKRNKKYSLKPAEWKFLAQELSTNENKKSAYQVKRTWHAMRRRVYLKMRRQTLGKESRSTPKRKRRYFTGASLKRSKLASPDPYCFQESSNEEDIIDLDFSTTDSLSSPVLSAATISPASSNCSTAKVAKVGRKRSARKRGLVKY